MPKPSRVHPQASAGTGVRPSARKRSTPPPVLASEALREDLAPFEPGRTMTRVCHVATAVVLLGVGIALRAGLGVVAGPPSADAVCAAAAAATGATAVA